MAMNREQKRRLQKQGQIDADGTAKAGPRRPVASPNAPREPRTTPREFTREVNAELRKVAWPSRKETINLSIIVLIFLVILTAFIALCDVGFSKSVFWLIGQ
jgi:preprotein translocase subunit SecE